MMAAGWLTQTEGPDARSRLVAITEAGRAKRAEAQRRWRAAQEGSTRCSASSASRRCTR